MSLENLRVAYLLESGFEDLEFHVPRMRLLEEGANLTVVDTGRQEQYIGKHGLIGTPDRTAGNVDPENFDAVVIPGGWAPDKLRRDSEILELVRKLDRNRDVIASICHAGWVPISAGIVEGRRATGSTGIKHDLENAGAEWVDEPAFREDHFVWGRVVKDIPD
jgi:protease I